MLNHFQYTRKITCVPHAQYVAVFGFTETLSAVQRLETEHAARSLLCFLEGKCCYASTMQEETLQEGMQEFFVHAPLLLNDISELCTSFNVAFYVMDDGGITPLGSWTQADGVEYLTLHKRCK